MAGFGWRRPSQRMEISPRLAEAKMGWRGNKDFPMAHFASGGVAGDANLGETFPTAQSQTPNQQGSDWDEALMPGEMDNWLLNRKASPYPGPLTAPVVDPNLVNNFNAQYGSGTASPFTPAPSSVPTVGANNSLVGDTVATPVPPVTAPVGQTGWMPPPPIQNDFNQGQDGFVKPMPPPQFLGPPVGPPGAVFTGTPAQGQGAWQGQPWNKQGNPGVQAFANRRRQSQPG